MRTVDQIVTEHGLLSEPWPRPHEVAAAMYDGELETLHDECRALADTGVLDLDAHLRAFVTRCYPEVHRGLALSFAAHEIDREAARRYFATRSKP